MKLPVIVCLVLVVVSPGISAETAIDVKVALFRSAIETANNAMSLHNFVAAEAESTLKATKDARQKRDMELVGVVLGTYGPYYKRYCSILQTLDGLEKKQNPSASDDVNRVELWRRLGYNRNSLYAASVKVATLAAQMGLGVPPNWRGAIRNEVIPAPAR